MSDNTVRKALIKDTSRNIDNISKQLNEGAAADKELVTELLTKMMDFCNSFVKAKTVDRDYSACESCPHSAMDTYLNEPVCVLYKKVLKEVTPETCEKVVEK